MKFEFNSFYDLGRMNGWEDGRASGLEEGEQKGVRNVLKQCIAIRFPQIAQTTMNSILDIADVDVLESILKVACKAESPDNFQRDIRSLIPIN